MKPITVITIDEIKYYDINKIDDARSFAKENDGYVFWRDDYYKLCIAIVRAILK